ncbi:MAG: hypothetical protein V4482_06590 [Pseudomonadota bacterium]
MLNKSDISFAHIDINRIQTLNPAPIACISYADGDSVFYQNQNAQTLSALNRGFDRFFLYHRKDIDTNFYAKNKEILDQKKGAGYWLWKPYFILKTLKELPEGSLVFYVDSPVIFKNSIEPFVHKLNETKTDILLLHDGSKRKNNLNKAGQTIKSEALTLNNIDPKLLNDQYALWGAFLIIRNTERGRAFVQTWLNLCENKDALTDQPFDNQMQRKEFKIHAHDQALLFVATQQKPDGITYITTDELKGIVKNVHRHPHQRTFSLIPDILGCFKISEWGYNGKFMQMLRSFAY